ncbi:MAG: type VI secretion system tube protein Hcp [Azoarcus sp.]|jgi:type VI secretion system secreted protein Hcp|nr:type VI secretion system tube protein Hcp [Azoarcus sp.]
MPSLQDFYVKLEGINGESKDSKHKGWIDALGFSYGVSQSSSMFTGGGGGVGKASFDTLSFTHYVDRATPNLFQYCAAGKHIPKVEVSACKAGDGSQEYLHITLEEVLVTHAGPVGSTDDARVKESVSLSYSKIKVEVKEQNADGTMGAVVTGTWDVKQNKS